MLIISPGKTEKEESRRRRLAHDRKLFGEEDMAQAGRYVSNMKTGTSSSQSRMLLNLPVT